MKARSRSRHRKRSEAIQLDGLSDAKPIVCGAMVGFADALPTLHSDHILKLDHLTVIAPSLAKGIQHLRIGQHAIVGQLGSMMRSTPMDSTSRAR
jgi:hypothetical protein